MANAVEKVNTIAIASIEAINTITDANLQALNTLEFTGVAPDAHTLISTHTASSSSSLDITSGIDSTYDVYEWVFTNMHPATNGVQWSFQVNADGGSGFNETITSTCFIAYHSEADATAFEYNTSYDQAQGTAYQPLTGYTGDQTDGSASGTLTLYAPSSTTYVKHFVATTQDMYDASSSSVWRMAGYINTTDAIDEISFKMSSGNIDAGVIKMYGIAKS
jgi:hypothetical protein